MAKTLIKAPKAIVYLIGAGATQSEVSSRGAAPTNLLMRDSELLGEGISTAILNAVGESNLIGITGGVDVEKLISLLSNASVQRLSRLAERMRQHYFEQIVERLVTSKVMDNPGLACALIELHAHRTFVASVERLSGVLTTNHDGLYQVAFNAVYGAINLGFPFRSKDFAQAHPGSVPPLLQLHGSFTWMFGVPARVNRLTSNSKYSADTMWIPPTIAKDARAYPFNKVAGQAYELLANNCDVLRIVGASMTQNDWNILSLIFTAQKHRECTRGEPFSIELIMPQERGTQLRDECSFLKKLTPIGFLTDGDFADFKDLPEALTAEQRNPFAYWLKQKILFHLAKGHLNGVATGKYTSDVIGRAI
jgi:hypothetical protein